MEDSRIKLKIFSLIKEKKITSEEGFQLLKGLSNKPVEKPVETATAQFPEIAVIGMAGRFPDAMNIEEYWENLKAGKDSVKEVPKDRWNTNEFYDPNPEAPNKSYCKFAAFLSDIDCFDPLFFNISPREASLMDPQQRLFLQESWTALEHAGYSPENLSDKKCGVFVGAASGDYLNLIRKERVEPDSYFLLGSLASVLAGRISYYLNLKGPALSVETACSSSLVAVHLACESIHAGNCEMALAGGAMVFTTPEYSIWSSKAELLSSDGRCKPFSAQADGMGISEAVGLVVLKPLQAALNDGDTIHGVIKASGINQDGKTNGLTVPNAEAQTELEIEVYKKAGITPESIGYMEAHGTGTKLGDPIEIEALTEAFERHTNKKQFCAIGSVKSNIGHGMIAAGIASFIKALLCLKHKTLVPTLHMEQENEHIEFQQTPFYPNKTLKLWTTEPGIPRRAAINSFGISGTNAHLILEEFTPTETTKKGNHNQTCLMPLSAKNETALCTYTERMVDFLNRNQNSELIDIAYTLQQGREAMNERIAMEVTTLEEFKQKLIRFQQGEFDIQQEQSELAKQWVAGESIKWPTTSLEQKPKRIPLPTYPFAKERYWVPTEESETASTITWNQQEETIQGYLTRYLAAELGMEAKMIQPDQNLMEYGVDSIIGMKMVRNIEKNFAIKIKTRKMIDLLTINAVATLITQKTEISQEKPDSKQHENPIEQQTINPPETFKQGQMVNHQENQKIVKNESLEVLPQAMEEGMDPAVIEALEQFKAGTLDLTALEGLIEQGELA